MEFKQQKISIFGIQKSGKSFLAKKLLQFFDSPVVFAPHRDDYADVARCFVYVPKDAEREFRGLCNKVLEWAKAGKCDCFCIDEADMVVRGNWDMNPALNDLILNHRHYNLALIFISRRPQDIPTKIVESCHYLFIFKLEGENALKKFRNIDRAVFDLFPSIEYGKFNFIVKPVGEPPYVNAAIQ